METTTDKKIVACKLTHPDFQKRKQEVLQGLRAQVLERLELTDGYNYKFAGTDELLDRVIAFIKSERECCQFFTFDLSVSNNESHIWLAITGPHGAKDFIRQEMDL
jgi:hypothetical protein